ncbi:uncharacterized protein LOC129604660 [Betta splendens]|uniref:Uncharacterized protein LOC129604660 n=1 Tax=Betta splendens TaxID=158456 RepID=A0A9W2Y279_BETSP|nr:uncharacterized protein LOC129604660 [Betta splendens]
MESYERESMRRIRRNSQTLLQDLFSRGAHGGGRDTPIPAQRGRDAGMIHSIASLIRAQSKLLLLEGPDTVEIYKLNEPAPPSTRASKDNLYLPAITAKASSLTPLRGSLSARVNGCHHSDRTTALSRYQSNLKAQREAKRSNVTVTMTYLGHGQRGAGLRSAPDELKVLQQVNGGENICVFKGSVRPGEQFQFVSQRHRGFPFSASLHVNGLVATRISCCCEYRYAPGFQQGRKGCFRLAWLQGGAPCYRSDTPQPQLNGIRSV